MIPKFRAWLIDENKMCEIIEINFPHKHVTLFINEKIIGTYIPFKKIHLMQWTGLKDKNGKEIFEGDIVKYKYIFSDKSIEEKIFKIEYMKLHNCSDCTRDSGIGFNFYLYEEDLDKIEIIGNIYENPELLEKVTK